jgi:putative membrane protein insertion efficiency factor
MWRGGSIMRWNMLGRTVIVAAIEGYRRGISPMLPPRCRFLPSCSEYAQEAVRRHGVLRGGLMALWRLLRCQPWGGGGFDPVRE